MTVKLASRLTVWIQLHCNVNIINRFTGLFESKQCDQKKSPIVNKSCPKMTSLQK